MFCELFQFQSPFNQTCLPFSELKEEFKTAKACNLARFQKSKDPCIRGTELKVDAVR